MSDWFGLVLIVFGVFVFFVVGISLTTKILFPKISNKTLSILSIGGALFIIITSGIIISSPSIIEDKLMMENCCKGSYCTDTYYTTKDNKCHLTLCENNIFNSKSKCTYDGLNITIDTLGLSEF